MEQLLFAFEMTDFDDLFIFSSKVSASSRRENIYSKGGNIRKMSKEFIFSSKVSASSRRDNDYSKGGTLEKSQKSLVLQIVIFTRYR
jgi:hypothetical protein